MTNTAIKTFETLLTSNSTDRAAWHRAGKALLVASYRATEEVAAELRGRAWICRSKAWR